MSNIRVLYGEIEQAAAQLGQGRDEMSSKLQGMQALIENLVATGFSTDHASGKFHGTFSEYTASATTLIAKLDDMQNFLLQASAAMRELDSQIAASIY